MTLEDFTIEYFYGEIGIIVEFKYNRFVNFDLDVAIRINFGESFLFIFELLQIE